VRQHHRSGPALVERQRDLRSEPRAEGQITRGSRKAQQCGIAGDEHVGVAGECFAEHDRVDHIE
jgi:hypothetical protein